MGTLDLEARASAAARRRFLRAVIEDLDALERMLDGDLFDRELRMGAEQELALLDEALQPSHAGEEVLRELEQLDPRGRFTTELGRCNLEANLTPRLLRGRCLSQLKQELDEVGALARSAAARHRAKVLLTGISPTFEPLHATRALMTQRARYAQIDAATVAAHGGRIPLQIQGIDGLKLWHDSVMLEGAATSFQVHLQLAPERFASAFNCSLLTAAPLLAAGANSPLFASRRLWHETRVPLLESVGDVRALSRWRRNGRSRTNLGGNFMDHSPVELLERDLASFEPLVVPAQLESSLEALGEGRVPTLQALTTFNGSVWRWIRPCYGVTGGKPHLRIENRVLPGGPTVLDEVANAALWLGWMLALPTVYGDIRRRIAYAEVEANFHAAARDGLDAALTWLDGKKVSARTLLRSELLPIARAGLSSAEVDADDIELLLGVVEGRVRLGQTGAAWMLRSFDAAGPGAPSRVRTWRVARDAAERCWSDEPVHRWSPVSARPDEHAQVPAVAAVRTELVTLSPDMPIAVAARVLRSDGSSHAVVEDENGVFLGVIGQADLARAAEDETVTRVGQVPLERPAPAELSRPAIGLLADLDAAGEGCRVVTDGNQLIGLVLREDLRALIRMLREGESLNGLLRSADGERSTTAARPGGRWPPAARSRSAWPGGRRSRR